MSLKILVPSYYSRVLAIMQNVGSGNRVLNIGCGDGYYNFLLSDRFKEVHGIDVNPTDIKIAKSLYAKKNISCAVASATTLPFPDNHFDRIICTEVLEHVRDHKKAIKEIARVLRKNGTAIITVPSADHPISFDPINWLLVRITGKHLPIGVWSYGHLRLYTMDRLETLFKEVGLKPMKRLYLLHFFGGIFENSYIMNFLQPLGKSDPKNLDISEKSEHETKSPAKIIYMRPPKVLRKIRDVMLRIDHILFGKSKKSLCIFLQVQKPAPRRNS